MAMKDNLMGIIKDPKGFYGKFAQTRWIAVAAKNPLERKVARLQLLSNSGTQKRIFPWLCSTPSG